MWQTRKNIFLKQPNERLGAGLKKLGKPAQGQAYPRSSSFLSMAFRLPYPAFLQPLRSCSVPDGLGRWPLTENDWRLAEAPKLPSSQISSSHWKMPGHLRQIAVLRLPQHWLEAKIPFLSIHLLMTHLLKLAQKWFLKSAEKSACLFYFQQAHLMVLTWW